MSINYEKTCDIRLHVYRHEVHLLNETRLKSRKLGVVAFKSFKSCSSESSHNSKVK